MIFGNFQSKITRLFWTYLKNGKEKICLFYRDLPALKILALISVIPCILMMYCLTSGSVATEGMREKKIDIATFIYKIAKLPDMNYKFNIFLLYIMCLAYILTYITKEF